MSTIFSTDDAVRLTGISRKMFSYLGLLVVSDPSELSIDSGHLASSLACYRFVKSSSGTLKIRQQSDNE